MHAYIHTIRRHIHTHNYFDREFYSLKKTQCSEWILACCEWSSILPLARVNICSIIIYIAIAFCLKFTILSNKWTHQISSCYDYELVFFLIIKLSTLSLSVSFNVRINSDCSLE